MTHESEQNAASEAAASSSPVRENESVAGQNVPGSAQDRLAKMPPDELKKTYRDARDLRDSIGFFIGLTVLSFTTIAGPLAVLLLAIRAVKSKNFVMPLLYLIAGVSLICVLLTFWSYRFTFAKWVIRIWMIALSVFAIVALVHVVSECFFFTADDGRIMLLEPSQIIHRCLYERGHLLFLSLGVFSLIFASRVCVITFNPHIFGPDRFSSFQIESFRTGLNLKLIPLSACPAEPGIKEKLITGIAVFGLVYLPPLVWWVVSSFMKGHMPF